MCQVLTLGWQRRGECVNAAPLKRVKGETAALPHQDAVWQDPPELKVHRPVASNAFPSVCPTETGFVLSEKACVRMLRAASLFKVKDRRQPKLLSTVD